MLVRVKAVLYVRMATVWSRSVATPWLLNSLHCGLAREGEADLLAGNQM